jgi:hypothetical protein
MSINLYGNPWFRRRKHHPSYAGSVTFVLLPVIPLGEEARQRRLEP